MLGSEGVQGGGKGLSQSKPATKILNCEPHGPTGSKQVTRAGCRTPPPLVPPLHKNQQEKPLHPAPPPPCPHWRPLGARRINQHTQQTHTKSCGVEPLPTSKGERRGML